MSGESLDSALLDEAVAGEVGVGVGHGQDTGRQARQVGGGHGAMESPAIAMLSKNIPDVELVLVVLLGQVKLLQSMRVGEGVLASFLLDVVHLARRVRKKECLSVGGNNNTCIFERFFAN